MDLNIGIAVRLFTLCYFRVFIGAHELMHGFYQRRILTLVLYAILLLSTTILPAGANAESIASTLSSADDQAQIVNWSFKIRAVSPYNTSDNCAFPYRYDQSFANPENGEVIGATYAVTDILGRYSRVISVGKSDQDPSSVTVRAYIQPDHRGLQGSYICPDIGVFPGRNGANPFIEADVNAVIRKSPEISKSGTEAGNPHIK